MVEQRSHVPEGPIRERLEEAFDEEASRRVETRLLASMKRRRNAARRTTGAGRARPRPRSAGMRWVAAAVVLLGAGAAAVLMGDRTASPDGNAAVRGDQDAGPLRVVSNDVVFRAAVADARDRTVALSDGSTIDLARETSVRVRRNDARRLELALSEGRADFEVQPGGSRAWSIDAGLARVEVVGTRFTLERRDATLRVTVQRGIVRVLASQLDGGSRLLETGQAVVVEREPVDEPAEPASQRNGGDGGTIERKPEVESVPRDARWRDYYRQGRYDSAYAELERTGIRAHTRRTHDTETLWAMADAARRSGHATDAVEPLRKLIRRAPQGNRAGLAAFTLARIHLEELDEPGQAASDFERAIELGLPQALERAARVRRVEALQATGRGDAAKRAAREYVRRHPDGEHADRMRSIGGTASTRE